MLLKSPAVSKAPDRSYSVVCRTFAEPPLFAILAEGQHGLPTGGGLVLVVHVPFGPGSMMAPAAPLQPQVPSAEMVISPFAP